MKVINACLDTRVLMRTVKLMCKRDKDNVVNWRMLILSFTFRFYHLLRRDFMRGNYMLIHLFCFWRWVGAEGIVYHNGEQRGRDGVNKKGLQ